MLSKKNTDRAVWFLLGTFLGGWVLGLIMGAVKGVQR